MQNTTPQGHTAHDLTLTRSASTKLTQISTSTLNPAQPASLAANESTVAAGTSALALQSLINDAVAGSVIHLAAGHVSFDRAVTVARDDIAVVGAGSDDH